MDNTKSAEPTAVNAGSVTEKDKNKNSSMKTFIKVLKIFAACTAVFVAVATAIICLILNSLATSRAEETFGFIENNILYDFNYYDSGIEKKHYYSFKDGYVSEELHYIDGEDPQESYVTGDITDYYKKYKIVTYWFSKKVGIYFSSDGKDWELFIKRKLIKSGSGEYFLDYDYGYDIEHIITERNDILCDHNYVSEVITVGTCQTEGEIKKTCVHCGKTETETVGGSHEYKNFVCVSCGDIDTKNLKGHTFYDYEGMPGIQFLNCVITSIDKYPTCITVHIEPVCGFCHRIMNVPESKKYFTILKNDGGRNDLMCTYCNLSIPVGVVYIVK